MTSKLTPIQRELRGNRDNWRLLRTKQGTQDDPDFVALQLDPRRTMVLVVGGTAADGDYTFDFSYVDEDGETVTGTILFERAAAEANAAIATALEGEIDGEATLAAAIAATTDVGATVLIALTAIGQENLVLSNFSAPVGATLAAEQTPSTTLPTRRDAHLGPAGEVRAYVVPIDVNGASLAPAAGTATLQAIECVDRDTTAAPTLEAAIGGSDELVDRPLYLRADMKLNGAQAFTIRISDAAATAPAGCVGYEVWLREAVT